jgi:four helix bundle protein
MDNKKFLQLNDISAYKSSFYLSNYIWSIVIQWDYFCKDTVGKQFARSADSISANLAEGFGRRGRKDKVKFYYYSFGSVNESLDWNEKAYKRNLLKEEEYLYIFQELKKLPKDINSLIKYTYTKLKT